MIDYEAFVRIKHYHQQEGLSPSQIAAALDLDERTVRKWLVEKHYHPRTPAPRQSKLDPLQSLYHPPPGDPSLYRGPALPKDPGGGL